MDGHSRQDKPQGGGRTQERERYLSIVDEVRAAERSALASLRDCQELGEVELRKLEQELDLLELRF